MGAGFYYVLSYVFSLLLLSSVPLRLVSPFLGFLALAGFPPLSIFWAKVVALLSSSFFRGCSILLITRLGLYSFFYLGVLFPFYFSTSLTFFCSSQSAFFVFYLLLVS